MTVVRQDDDRREKKTGRSDRTFGRLCQPVLDRTRGRWRGPQKLSRMTIAASGPSLLFRFTISGFTLVSLQYAERRRLWLLVSDHGWPVCLVICSWSSDRCRICGLGFPSVMSESTVRSVEPALLASSALKHPNSPD